LVVVPVVAVDRSLWARFNKGDEFVDGGGGRDGLLRPTEFERSRLEDNVLDKNEPDDFEEVSPFWLLVFEYDNLRPRCIYLVIY
jgi:hypothetical protein